MQSPQKSPGSDGSESLPVPENGPLSATGSLDLGDSPRFNFFAGAGTSNSQRITSRPDFTTLPKFQQLAANRSQGGSRDNSSNRQRRDRYGFEIKQDAETLSAFEQFESEYPGILERRHAKWLEYCDLTSPTFGAGLAAAASSASKSNTHSHNPSISSTGKHGHGYGSSVSSAWRQGHGQSASVASTSKQHKANSSSVMSSPINSISRSNQSTSVTTSVGLVKISQSTAQSGAAVLAWPTRSDKTKRYIRKGIPNAIRGQAWMYYSGAEELMFENPGHYNNLLTRIQEARSSNECLVHDEAIRRDLHRTFPENVFFQWPKAFHGKDMSPEQIIDVDRLLANPEVVPPGCLLLDLYSVLLAFSLHAPNIGYCQSLNYIAGMLLLFLDEQEAFWLLVKLVVGPSQILGAHVYDNNLEGAAVDQEVLSQLIRQRLPLVWNKLNELQAKDAEEASHVDGNANRPKDKDKRMTFGLPITLRAKRPKDVPTAMLPAMSWFLTLYVNALPTETVLRVWDCLFYEGSKIVRIALTILKLCEQKILASNDSLDTMILIQVCKIETRLQT